MKLTTKRTKLKYSGKSNTVIRKIIFYLTA